MVQNFQGLNSGVTLEFQPNLYLVKYFGTVFYFDTLNYNCQFFFLIPNKHPQSGEEYVFSLREIEKHDNKTNK